MWVQPRCSAHLTDCLVLGAPGDGLVAQGAGALARAARTQCSRGGECGFLALQGGRLELGPGCMAAANQGEAGFAACLGGALVALPLPQAALKVRAVRGSFRSMLPSAPNAWLRGMCPARGDACTCLGPKTLSGGRCERREGGKGACL